MQRVTFLRGFPAAGKTTFAHRLAGENPNTVIVSADQCRLKRYGSQDKYGEPDVIYNDLLSEFKKYLADGKSVIYDAANLKRSYREDFMRDLQKEFAGVEKDIRVICDEVIRQQQCFQLKDLAIDGHDVMCLLGIKEGPGVGSILNEILGLVLNGDLENKRSCLVKYLKSRCPA